MNSPSSPQTLPPEPSPQAGLAPAEGLSMVWHSRFGAMRIEVIHGQPHVNGQRIEPLLRPTVPQEAP
ncbi:hypothetical protein [Inhella proteolytica]|uniref:Uncharacterized protein n=1 Tax=Inhella proteolytica TaxID=2795029 RepID=A0A931J3L1_9BURK|nr:hypothetical protein [Inhella proteolytica]MBH9578138.1 hypothetical protein [Inhella proteolytica]